MRKIYHCAKCKDVFDNPKTVGAKHNGDDAYPGDLVCPVCGCDAFYEDEEAVEEMAATIRDLRR